MDSNLINLLQKYVDPIQSLLGYISYIKKHTSNLQRLLEYVTEKCESGTIQPSDDSDELIPLSTNIAPDSQYVTYTTYTELNKGLKAFFADETGMSEDDVRVTVFRVNSDNTTTTVSELLSNVLGRASDAYNISGALILTLEGIREGAMSGVTDFVNLMRDKLSASNIKESVISSLLAALTNLRSSLNGLDAPKLMCNLPSVLHIFGVDGTNNSSSTSELSTYEGVNAYIPILAEFGISVVSAHIQLPLKLLHVISILGYGLLQACAYVGETLGNWIVDTYNTLTGKRDAFQVINEHGDGHIFADFAYKIPKNQAGFAYVLEAIFEAMDTNTITSLLPTGTIVVNNQNANEYWITFYPKIRAYGLASAFYALTPFKHLDVFPYTPGSDSLDSNSYYADRHNLASTPMTWNEFELFMDYVFSPATSLDYSLPSGARDSDFIWSIMESQFLTYVLGYLYEIALTDTWDGNTLFDALLYASDSMPKALLDALAVSPGTVTASNRTAMALLYSLQPGNTAFVIDGFTLSPTLENVQTFDNQQRLDMLYVIVTLARYGYVETSVENGLGHFLPYSLEYVTPNFSFQVPDDNQNMTTLKGFLLSGFKKVAVVVAVVATFIVLKKLRFKAYAMSQVASAKSFDAGTTGNAAAMLSAYKLNRRARLLSNTLGVATAAGTTAITSNLPLDDLLSSYEGDLSDIKQAVSATGKLIKPDFPY